MARGSISHIALTVSDLERSTAFYDKVFEFIGFKRAEVPESTQQAMKTLATGSFKAIISFLHADYRFKTSLQLAIDLAVIDRICCIINIQHLTDEFSSMP